MSNKSSVSGKYGDAPYRNAELSNRKPELDDLNEKDVDDTNAAKRRYRLLKDLPTFKAGGTFHISAKGSLVSDNEFSKGIVAYARSTLAKFPSILTDWFEEIKPQEPLIRDEKIRKAVRAWAEANDIDPEYYHDTNVKFDSIEHRLTWIETSIEFNDITGLEDLEDGATYTIDELCGEEEE